MGAVEPGAELGEVGDDEPAGDRGRRGAHVGDQVEQRRVLLVADRADHRHAASRDGADEPLVGEGQQILEAAAAAGDDDHVGAALAQLPSAVAIAGAAAGPGRTSRRRATCAGGKRAVIAVSTSRLAAASLPVTSPISRGIRGSGRLRVGGEQALGGELLLQPLERGEVRAEPVALDRERPEVEVAPLLVQLRTAVDVHALAVREPEPQRRRTARAASGPRGRRRSPDP